MCRVQLLNGAYFDFIYTTKSVRFRSLHLIR